MPDEFKSKGSSKGARWEVRWRLDSIIRRKYFCNDVHHECSWEIEDRMQSNRYMDLRDCCRLLGEVADLWSQGLVRSKNRSRNVNSHPVLGKSPISINSELDI